MAQSASIRLNSRLVKKADSVGKRYKRSPPRQIEYWAELGRKVEQYISPEDLIAIEEGLSQVVVTSVWSAPVSTQQVFADLERDRRNNTLSTKVSSAAVNYQRSSAHPGFLEQINADGSRLTGRFVKGKFMPIDK